MIRLQTSIEDLTSTLKCSIEYYNEGDFQEAIKNEESGQKRVTVIKLLKRGLRMKQQGARHI